MPVLALPNASQDLSGQFALVPGAALGLIDRFARALAASGANLAVGVRWTNQLAALVETNPKAGGWPWG